MATPQDYIDALHKVHVSVETLRRKIRMAYDSAQATTNDGTYDRLERLVDEASRTTFKDTLKRELFSGLQNAGAALPEEALFSEALVANAFYGFTPAELDHLVDSAKDKLSYDGFMQFLEKQTRLSEVIQTREQAPVSILGNVPNNAVVGYVNQLGRINPDRLTLQDKVELMGTYDRLGVIPPKLLENKPYLQ